MSDYRRWGGFTGVKTSIDWGLHFFFKFPYCPASTSHIHTKKRNRKRVGLLSYFRICVLFFFSVSAGSGNSFDFDRKLHQSLSGYASILPTAYHPIRPSNVSKVSLFSSGHTSFAPRKESGRNSALLFCLFRCYRCLVHCYLSSLCSQNASCLCRDGRASIGQVVFGIRHQSRSVSEQIRSSVDAT